MDRGSTGVRILRERVDKIRRNECGERLGPLVQALEELVLEHIAQVVEFEQRERVLGRRRLAVVAVRLLAAGFGDLDVGRLEARQLARRIHERIEERRRRQRHGLIGVARNLRLWVSEGRVDGVARRDFEGARGRQAGDEREAYHWLCFFLQ